jgi:hypothetical protein
VLAAGNPEAEEPADDRPAQQADEEVDGRRARDGHGAGSMRRSGR